MPAQNPLGEKISYSGQYDAGLLFPIARTESRQHLVLAGELPFRGEDRWTAYEVSWLDQQGKPQVRLAEFLLNSDSPNIIESKSFKLYLNSFNHTRFDDEQQVKSQFITDLSAVAGSVVTVEMMPLNSAHMLLMDGPIGICLDGIDVTIDEYHPNPKLLKVLTSQSVNEVLYSHLLKTNCPVTGQPDWATVFIEYTGPTICQHSLLKYIISFREHHDFHENSVERLFCDINAYCCPEHLAVYARYTRRGGLDINPLRSNYPEGIGVLGCNTMRIIRQ